MELQHPRFADVTVEVDGDEAIAEHVEAGWLKPTTKAAKQLKADAE